MLTAEMLARLAAVGLAAGVFMASASRTARAVDFGGVNDTLAAWRPAGKREEQAAALAAAGARHVRIMAVRPLDAVAASAAALTRKGIGVLVVVPMGQADFFPPDVAARAAEGVHYPLRPTHAMEIARYAAFWREALAALDAVGVAPIAVEVGNEINISPFDASLPVTPGGVVAEAEGFERHSFAGTFGRALDRYVEALRETKAALIGRGVPVLLASLVRPEPDWAAANAVSAVAPELAMRMLVERGADRIADGLAVHLYPQVGARDEDPDAAVAKAVAQAFDPLVREAGPGRVWWITEWGFARAVGKDSGLELTRGRRMRAFADAIRSRPEAARMGPAFLYDFSEDELFRIHGPDGPSDPDALLTLAPR